MGKNVKKKLCAFKTCFYIHSKSIISIANRSFVANAGCLFTFILQSNKLFSLARYQISQLFSLAKYAAAHNNPAYTFPKSCLFSLHQLKRAPGFSLRSHHISHKNTRGRHTPQNTCKKHIIQTKFTQSKLKHKNLTTYHTRTQEAGTHHRIYARNT